MCCHVLMVIKYKFRKLGTILKGRNKVKKKETVTKFIIIIITNFFAEFH